MRSLASGRKRARSQGIRSFVVGGGGAHISPLVRVATGTRTGAHKNLNRNSAHFRRHLHARYQPTRILSSALNNETRPTSSPFWEPSAIHDDSLPFNQSTCVFTFTCMFCHQSSSRSSYPIHTISYKIPSLSLQNQRTCCDESLQNPFLFRSPGSVRTRNGMDFWFDSVAMMTQPLLGIAIESVRVILDAPSARVTIIESHSSERPWGSRNRRLEFHY